MNPRAWKPEEFGDMDIKRKFRFFFKDGNFLDGEWVKGEKPLEENNSQGIIGAWGPFQIQCIPASFLEATQSHSLPQPIGWEQVEALPRTVWYNKDGGVDCELVDFSDLRQLF